MQRTASPLRARVLYRLRSCFGIQLQQLDRKDAFGEGATHFDSVESLVAAVAPIAAGFGAVLVKGSRFMRMERVLPALGQAQESTRGGHH